MRHAVNINAFKNVRLSYVYHICIYAYEREMKIEKNKQIS